MQFKTGNTAHAKPRWSVAEIRAFQKTLREFQTTINYTNPELARALDYSIKYVEMMRGQFGYHRQPSQEFLRRFNSLKASAPAPKPRFTSALAFNPHVDAIPVARILGAIKQCPECLWELKRGYRNEADTWWVMRVPRQIYHSKDHRQANTLRRRRAQSRRRRRTQINERSKKHGK